MAHEFLVWVEVEEVDEGGDQVEDHSTGAAVATFASLDEAMAFAAKLQDISPEPDDDENRCAMCGQLLTAGDRTLGNCGHCKTPIGIENPRERGDDDGIEYADPRDHRDGRE